MKLLEKAVTKNLNVTGLKYMLSLFSERLFSQL